MSGADRDANGLRAGDANFAQMVVRAGIGDDRVHALPGVGIGYHTATAQHNASNSLDDHRRHDDERNGCGIDILERRRIRQMVSVLIEQMQRCSRDESPGARIIFALEDWLPCRFARVSDNPEPIAGASSIRKDIQRPASEGFWRIARKAAELAVRAVAVKRSTSGECHAAIILLDDIVALNITYRFHFIIA